MTTIGRQRLFDESQGDRIDTLLLQPALFFAFSSSRKRDDRGLHRLGFGIHLQQFDQLLQRLVGVRV